MRHTDTTCRNIRGSESPPVASPKWPYPPPVRNGRRPVAVLGLRGRNRHRAEHARDPSRGTHGQCPSQGHGVKFLSWFRRVGSCGRLQCHRTVLKYLPSGGASVLRGSREHQLIGDLLQTEHICEFLLERQQSMALSSDFSVKTD